MKNLLLVLFFKSLLTSQVFCQDADYGDLFIEDPLVGRPGQPTTTFKPTTVSRTTTNKIEKAEEPYIDVNINGTWDDEKCDLEHKCVRYYLCIDDKINTDGRLLINPRLDKIGATPETICPKLEKCCKKADYMPKEKICTDHYSTPKKCGRRNEKGIGGSVLTMETTIVDKDSYPYANYAEFPWMMAVLSIQTAGSISLNVFRSGGSLIHPKVVLTAAHNIQNLTLSKLFVRGGEWDTQTENEMCKHEERFVERIITHEAFDDTNYQNDIALVILKKEFQMTPFINTICLPPKGMKFEGKRCLSSGWGKTKFGRDERYQVFLKRIELPIVSSELCQQQLRRTLLGEDFILNENFLCAGGEEGIDTCTGDGGSPLVCEIDGSPYDYYQAGVVIAGIGCGKRDIPGFYADVSMYRDWIDRKFSELGFDSSTYSH